VRTCINTVEPHSFNVSKLELASIHEMRTVSVFLALLCASLSTAQGQSAQFVKEAGEDSVLLKLDYATYRGHLDEDTDVWSSIAWSIKY
jgi:hypothetical protein